MSYVVRTQGDNYIVYRHFWGTNQYLEVFSSKDREESYAKCNELNASISPPHPVWQQIVFAFGLIGVVVCAVSTLVFLV